MHFSAALTLGAVATASAIVLPRQSTEYSTFQIDNFSAGHEPHGVTAFVSFNVSMPSIGASSAYCSGSNSSTYNEIGDYAIQTCEGSAYLWGLDKNSTTGLYDLTLVHPNAITFTGTYTFPASADNFVQSPAGSGFAWERLTAPSNPFNIDASGQTPAK